jgi:hypothetical protein
MIEAAAEAPASILHLSAVERAREPRGNHARERDEHLPCERCTRLSILLAGHDGQSRAFYPDRRRRPASRKATMQLLMQLAPQWSLHPTRLTKFLSHRESRCCCARHGTRCRRRRTFCSSRRVLHVGKMQSVSLHAMYMVLHLLRGTSQMLLSGEDLLLLS